MAPPCTTRTHPLLMAGMLMTAALPAAAQEQAGENPLELGVAYTGDLRRNVSGGLATGTAYSEVFDLGLTWRTTALGSHLTANLSVMYTGGDEISAELVGDLQGVNSLEAAPRWRLYESWVEFGFGDGANSLRAGVLDLNAEFDTPVTQGLFTASPFWIGTDLSQTGLRGPVVWPVTGLGVRAAGAVNENWQWRAGAYDGAPGSDEDGFTSFELSRREGALLIGEIAYSSERIYKFSVAAWAYTADFEPVDSALRPDEPPANGNHGFYTTFDAPLGSVGDVRFDAALRAGTAPERFNAVDRYVGAAIVAHRFWKTRPEDQIGLGVAWARLGASHREVSAFEGNPTTSAETLFELTYRAEVAPSFALVPNIQFVRHPGATLGSVDSWIAGLRFELSHSFRTSART